MGCQVYYHRIGDVLRKDCVISGNIIYTIHTSAPNVNPIKPAQHFRSTMAFARTPQQKHMQPLVALANSAKDASSVRNCGNSLRLDGVPSSQSHECDLAASALACVGGRKRA
jgi:hypothetical protein